VQEAKRETTNILMKLLKILDSIRHVGDVLALCVSGKRTGRGTPNVIRQPPPSRLTPLTTKPSISQFANLYTLRSSLRKPSYPLTSDCSPSDHSPCIPNASVSLFSPSSLPQSLRILPPPPQHRQLPVLTIATSSREAPVQQLATALPRRLMW
jgi:hypothetical protein